MDTFEGMQLTWELVTTENQKTSLDYDSGFYASETAEHKSFHLSFSKIFKDKVLNKYLPYVAERSKAIKETKKVIKLYSLGAADSNCRVRAASTQSALWLAAAARDQQLQRAWPEAVAGANATWCSVRDNGVQLRRLVAFRRGGNG